MPDPARQAVFLSYASQDATAAARICADLRAVGVEVWFDQNELVGGDAWDGKIRRQIAECALFVPIISAHTEARLEGYFRLEWKLAAQRTHTMADEKTFLLPVVIDATRDTEAKVPAEFKAVQWTRLPPSPSLRRTGRPAGYAGQGGEEQEGPERDEARAAFCARVVKLLGGAPALQPLPGPVPASAPTAPASSPAAPVSVPRRSPAISWILLATVAAAVAVGVYFTRRPAPAAAASPATTVEPKASQPVAAVIPEKSIAVLPFANLSPDAENAFFADGMHDDLITALAKIRDLKVISRTSMLPYKTGERNVRKIAADLGVATILEGSVQRMGNRVTARKLDFQGDWIRKWYQGRFSRAS